LDNWHFHRTNPINPSPFRYQVSDGK
jgi:hypothetical protein